MAEIEYEAWLAAADPGFVPPPLADEWQAISLNYTSGTTGNPKGVVYHHRGAYLNSLSDVLTMKLDANSVYLWTLPMFHCNGWCFTWAVVAACGTHVCLRKVDPAVIYPMIRDYKVTHLCGAPIVLNILANAPDSVKVKFDQVVEVGTGGAAPPSAIIEAMNRNGFNVTHLYGLTETYGPATVCAWQEAWVDLDLEARSRNMAKQGVSHITQEAVMVADPITMTPVPPDGETIGEIMIRGNTVMKGYLKNPRATEEAFRGGWYHSGDLGVCHPDGYIEVKDRAKDIVISGGENVDLAAVQHACDAEFGTGTLAVLAIPDARWGAKVVALSRADLDLGRVQAILEPRLGKAAAPKELRRVEHLAYTSIGKIDRTALQLSWRELGEDGDVG